MRKRVFGRKLKRNINQRKALFRSLMASLVLNGKIKTTEAKAKAIKGEVEKLVTRAKKNGEVARRILTARLVDKKVVDKIIAEIAPKFAARPGGYTRLLKLGPRLKDNAPMVMMSWVEEIAPTTLDEPKRSKVKRRERVQKPKAKEESKKTNKKEAKKERVRK